MSKHNIEIVEIVAVDGNLVVRGTVGEAQFEAQNLRWGSKMLMHVKAAGLDRGTRVAIGHRAKAAIKAAGLVLPEAVLKRPRKEAPATVTVTVDPVLQIEAAPLPILVEAEEGFFTLSGIEA